MPTGRLFEATGKCVVDTDFIINDNDCQLKLSIDVNSRIDFVFAQKNAAHCIGEQNKKGDIDKRL